MSGFSCDVVRVKIEPHPNADAIEICRVGDYQSIVKKGQFEDGDLAVYIPEQAVIPVWMLQEMGFWDLAKNKGMLSGGAGNRVRAIKLRGVLSQGLMYPVKYNSSLHCHSYSVVAPYMPEISKEVSLGHIPVGEVTDIGQDTHDPVGFDAAEILGIIKYEPPLPSHMAARVLGVDFGSTHKYDFDNLKKMPKLFDDGEEVVITEKIHGTFLQVGVVPESAANNKYYKRRVIISSKGMGGKGYVLDHDDPTNLYAQAAIKHGLLDAMLEHGGPLADAEDKPVFLLGEVFGKTASGAGVQDLTYTGETLDFRAFDICVGNRGNEEYMDWDSFCWACDFAGIETVPVMYVGPYSKEEVLKHTNGFTVLQPSDAPRGQVKASCIREGVVVKSLNEVRHPSFGRKIAKSVSEAYLLRKAGTEFN